MGGRLGAAVRYPRIMPVGGVHGEACCRFACHDLSIQVGWWRAAEGISPAVGAGFTRVRVTRRRAAISAGRRLGNGPEHGDAGEAILLGHGRGGCHDQDGGQERRPLWIRRVALGPGTARSRPASRSSGAVPERVREEGPTRTHTAVRGSPGARGLQTSGSARRTRVNKRLARSADETRPGRARVPARAVCRVNPADCGTKNTAEAIIHTTYQAAVDEGPRVAATMSGSR